FKEILNGACSEFRQEIAETETTITSNFDLAPEIKTIPAYLHSIFHNLISNAIKFRSPDRNLHIEISSELKNDCVCLVIKDNGLGIDLEKYGQKVFILYNRFHLHEPVGKGVGLSLVKTQIEALGGKIELESAPDKGCTFRLYFPL
ncbi:MAG: ATP-binding protein, partial [Chitinophagaceae bacterium]